MALEVSMTGSGTIGDIAPGWSVSESTNSVAIGDTGAGTGSVSFTARATDDSLLVINNDVVSTVNNLGTVHGVVQSVSESGIAVSVTHGTVADKLNLDVDVQPVPEGGPKAWCSALEYAIGIGPNPYNAPVSYVPSFANEGVSFGFFNSTLSDDYIYPLSTFLNYSNGYPATPTYNVGNGTAQVTQGVGNTTAWTTLTGSALSDINTIPDWFSVGEASYLDISNSMVVQFCLNDNSSSKVSIGLCASTGTSKSFIVTADGATKKFGQLTSAYNVDYSSLDSSKPLMFTIRVYKRALSDWPSFIVRMTVTDHTNASVYSEYNLFAVNSVSSFPNAKIYIPYHQVNTADIKYINFYTINKDVTNSDIQTYIEPADFSGTITPSLFDFSGYTGTSVATYPATSGVAWELLQQLASAENFEIAISGDTVYIRDVGTTAFDITNVGATPSINPESTLSGREIVIPYTDAYYTSGTIYDAQEDGNNIISVEAGATTVTSVKWNVSPLTVNSPTRSDVWPVNPGEYYVIDSAGLPLLAGEWEAYGAYVTANIDPNDSSAIQITVKGPTTDTTLAGGPYKLAASDSGVEYAALKIAGTGVYSGDNQLNLTTAIDTTKYTRATVNTIYNPFINTLEQAYDRGAWASLKASGPTVTINLSVPISSIQGIGLTCGSLIDYRYSTYRITSCTLNGIMANITADFYATVGRVDESWDGQTVFDFDLAWSYTECQDQIIFPYLHSEPPPI